MDNNVIHNGIHTDFYIRIGNLKPNFKYDHIKLFRAYVFAGNIWIEERYEIDNFDSRDDIDVVTKNRIKAHYNEGAVMNFMYTYSAGYNHISDEIVNTHFDWCRRGVQMKDSVRVFTKLNKKERRKIKRMLGELEFQRNPIQFKLMWATFLSVGVSLFMGVYGIISDRYSEEECTEHKTKEEPLEETKEVYKLDIPDIKQGQP